MLSSPLRQHILSSEPPHGFVMPAFTMFDGSNDPYDPMLHYNQAMTLNIGNDSLLCKGFPASLRGPALAWFQKFPCNSINPFNKLWTAFISQYLYSVWQKRNKLFVDYSKAGRGIHTRLHKEVRASRPVGRGLHHGCSPSEIQEKLWAIHFLLLLTVFRPTNDN